MSWLDGSRHATRSISPPAIFLRILFVSLWGFLAVQCDDPREYRDNFFNGESVDELVVRFKLAVPSCRITNLRYANVGGPMGSDMYLTYTFPANCLDEFLVGNGLSQPIKISEDLQPFYDPLVAEFRWPLDALKGHDYYETGGVYGTVRTVVDTSGPSCVVYIHAIGP